ncbi:MAG: glycoside hydrolase family 6 protein [Myxococcota bacterium]|nr:glycoside hydrolase family 6 protein [Myxococcota bacterium]
MRTVRFEPRALVAITALAGCAPSPSVPASAPPVPEVTAAAPHASASPAPSAAVVRPTSVETASANPPTAGKRVKGQNPFLDVRLYVNEYGQAAQQARSWAKTRPDDAKLIAKIGDQPSGWWMGEWSGDIETAVHALGNATASAGTVPVIVAYNVPNRDCGQYSAGGSVSAEAYHDWIRQFAKGANGYRLIVVLEPDALGLMTKCLSAADQKARLEMIHDAVDVLEATPGTAVYIDAGNANWTPPKEMAKRLMGAGIADADGFALNVSNYIATDKTIAYGHAIAAAIGGKHFIIDTGRNGNGATGDSQWCNPDGRALGSPPTTKTGDPLIDAFFWVKPPGESDGTCNGGPKAGQFWPEMALGLSKRATW